MAEIDGKICGKCKIYKVRAEFGAHSKTKDKMQTMCKTCKNLASKNRQNAIKNQPKILIDEKECTKCKLTLPIDNFQKCVTSKNGVQAKCKKCRSTAQPKEILPENHRKCCACKLILTIDNFSTFVNGKTKSSCKQCTTEYNKKYVNKIKIEPKKIIEQKECTKCKIIKNVDCFNAHCYSRDGKSSHCRDCLNQYTKTETYKINYRLKYLPRQKIYYTKNKDKILQRDKIKRLMNKKPKKIRKRMSLEQAKESKKIRGKKYRNRNREMINLKRKENAHKYQKKYNEWRKQNYDNNPNFKLSHLFRAAFLKALRGKNKTNSVIKLLGCSILEFKSYIETQFDENMNWNNFGEYWAIDHIIPVCYFNHSIPNEVAACWHYTNFQPLEKISNIIKSGSLSAVLPINCTD